MQQVKFWVSALRSALANLDKFDTVEGGGAPAGTSEAAQGLVTGREDAPTRVAALMDALQALHEICGTYFSLLLMQRTGIVAVLQATASHRVRALQSGSSRQSNSIESVASNLPQQFLQMLLT